MLPKDGEALYTSAFLLSPEADDLLAHLLVTVPWKQESIRLFGRDLTMPRLTAWYGDPQAVYTYSGLTNQPLPWLGPLARLRARLERATGARFNSALLNLYRDGNDAMGWHADNEPELGPKPTIASVSLGAKRIFEMRHRVDGGRVRYSLEHGSLLVMSGDSQRAWMHRVAKSRAVVDPRINLTFREVARRPSAEERTQIDGRPHAR